MDNNKGTEEINFELIDTTGSLIRLSDFRGKKNILLVLLRGFA